MRYGRRSCEKCHISAPAVDFHGEGSRSSSTSRYLKKGYLIFLPKSFVQSGVDERGQTSTIKNADKNRDRMRVPSSVTEK